MFGVTAPGQAGLDLAPPFWYLLLLIILYILRPISQYVSTFVVPRPPARLGPATVRGHQLVASHKTKAWSQQASGINALLLKHEGWPLIPIWDQ